MHWRKLALCRFGQCCKSGEEGGRVTCLPSPPFPPPLFLPISVHFLLLPSASFYPSVSQMMDHTHPRTPRGRDQQVASEEFPDQISVPATNNLALPWFRIRSIWSLSPLIHYPPLPFPFCSAFCLFPLTFDPSVCVHLLPPAADDSSFIYLLLRPFLSHWSSAS